MKLSLFIYISDVVSATREYESESSTNGLKYEDKPTHSSNVPFDVNTYSTVSENIKLILSNIEMDLIANSIP